MCVEKRSDEKKRREKNKNSDGCGPLEQKNEKWERAPWINQFLFPKIQK